MSGYHIGLLSHWNISLTAESRTGFRLWKEKVWFGLISEGEDWLAGRDPGPQSGAHT